MVLLRRPTTVLGEAGGEHEMYTSPSLIGNPNAEAAALAACRATAGSCPQGISNEVITSGLGRVTMQVSSKNKLQVYVDRIHKDRASARAPATIRRRPASTGRRRNI